MKRFTHHLLRLVAILAAVVLLASCHTQKKGVRPETKYDREHVTPPAKQHLSKTRKKILEEADTWLGTPYGYAHSEKGKATDCSGFVMMTYLDATGVALPRNSAKQAEYCRRIDRKDVLPGDLVFFATGNDPGRVSHVGIVVDEERFIHASSKKGVTISLFSNQWYARRLLMFGRALKD